MTWLEILLKHGLLHHPTNVATVQGLQFIHSKLNEILEAKQQQQNFNTHCPKIRLIYSFSSDRNALVSLCPVVYY